MNIKINRLLSIFFFLSIFFAIISTPVFAAKPSPRIVVGANLREYKPPTKDHCDINVSSQFSTIQAAIDAATPGDTVCVGVGTYNEDIFVNKSVRLSGKGVSKSIINGQNPNADTVDITADNVTLEGFLINGVSTNVVVAINGSDSGPVSEAIVQYNRVVAGSGGIALRTIRVQNSIMQNNLLEGNNSPFIAYLGGLGSVNSIFINFLNNTLIGSVNPNDRQDTGITLVLEPPGLIQRNVFNINGNPILLISANIYSLINENNFNGNNPALKLHGGWGPLVLNAENNWWGDNDPSDNVLGEVDYTPFATTPFKEN